MPRKKPHRKQVQAGIEERRVIVAQLYKRGWLQGEIAKKVGVNFSVISRDLKAIREQWLQSALRNFDEAKAHELERLNEIEREAWDAWQRSQQPAEITKTKGKTEERIRKGQCGDPRFLETVHKCIAKRCELLGLNAPFKVAATDTNGNDLSTDDARSTVVEILALLRIRGGEGEDSQSARSLGEPEPEGGDFPSGLGGHLLAAPLDDGPTYGSS